MSGDFRFDFSKKSKGKKAVKPVPENLDENAKEYRERARAEARVRADGLAAAPAEDLLDLIEQMNEQMRVAAENLQFELAARLRDELADLTAAVAISLEPDCTLK